jgi:FkbM family methyltransferase
MPIRLHYIKFLRKIVLPLLSKYNLGDITIKHPWVGAPKKMMLHSFKHKGYWYHGKKREKESMLLFKRFINPGSVVIEVGGHIGYLSIYFSDIVKSDGRVYVFEPGKNNLPYIRKNIEGLKNLQLIEKAVGNKCGKTKFYIENITGQNNSLMKDYKVLNKNKEFSFLSEKSREIEEVEIEITTLDNYCEKENIKPDFIKIDVEGAELSVLEGMVNCLRNYRPRIMLEVTRDIKAVLKILKEEKYLVFDIFLKPITNQNLGSFNVFCFPKDDSFIKGN